MVGTINPTSRTAIEVCSLNFIDVPHRRGGLPPGVQPALGSPPAADRKRRQERRSVPSKPTYILVVGSCSDWWQPPSLEEKTSPSGLRRSAIQPQSWAF